MIRHTGLIARIISIAAFVMTMCSASWGAGIRVVPSNTVVKPGDDFYFDVVAEGIPAQGLGGVQFRLAVIPSVGAAKGVADLSQGTTSDIAVVTPLLISPAVTGRSGMGDFFWNGKGANGILTLDNETLDNGSALYTFAHTNGSTPQSGSGTIARFAGHIGSSVKAERLEISLADVLLMDGGPAYTMEYVSGTSLQLRCLSKAPSLAGLTLNAAQTAITAANLTLGNVYEINNQNGILPLGIVLEQSSVTGSELDCGTSINLAINTPPVDVTNLTATSKSNDEGGTVRLSWAPSVSADSAGYRIYSGSTLLKQVTSASATTVEIGGLVNGVITRLRVTAYDILGNENSGIFVDAKPLDDVPPVITVTDVSEGSFYRSDITPQVTVSDASPVTWSATINGVPFSIAPIATDGNYALTVSAVDQAGNRSSKTVTFVMDKTTPIISVTGVADTAFYKTPVSPTVLINDVNIQTISITLDDQPYLSGTTVDIDGSHILLINTVDMAENSASQTIHFTIDKSPPLLTVSTLADGSYTNNRVLNIAGNVTDNTGVKELAINSVNVELQADGSFSHALELVIGDNRIEIKTDDLAGNTVINARTITLDQTAPLIDVTSPADNSKTSRQNINVSGNVDETSVVEVRLAGVTQPVVMNGEAFSATSTLIEGYNTIEIIATDPAGNFGSEKRTVIFDDQKPSLSVTEPGQDIRTNRDVLILKGISSDALTAVAITIVMDGETYTPSLLNGTFEQRITLSGEGNHAIVVTGTDEVGNSISVARNVIYDITPPQLTIDPTVTPTNLFTALLNGSMDEGSAVEVVCSTATIGPVEYPTPVTWRTAISGLSAGNNAITVTVTDVAGNETVASTEIIHDITPPTGNITINNGALYSRSTQVNITLAAHDDSGVARMRFSNDGVIWSSTETYATALTWILPNGDGPKQVFVQYQDNAGNWSEIASTSIVLDTTPPRTSLSTKPALVDGVMNTVAPLISCTLSASDALSGVKNIWYRFDSGTWNLYSAPFSLSGFTAGNHTLGFAAEDGTGNSEPEQNITLRLLNLQVHTTVSTVPSVLVSPQDDQDDNCRHTQKNGADKLAAILKEQGIIYYIASDDDDYERALRSGRYNVHILLDYKNEKIDRELREAVHAGNGLIVVRTQPFADLDLDEVIGVNFGGKITENDSDIDLDEGDLSGKERFAGTGKGVRVSLTSKYARVKGRIRDKHEDVPAVITNFYGDGKVILYAFDLFGSVSEAKAGELIGKALEYVRPVSRAVDPLGEVPVDIAIENSTEPFGLEVVEIASAGTIMHTIPTGIVTGTVVIWRQNLDASQKAHFGYFLALPDAKGEVNLDTVVNYASSGGYTLLTETELKLKVAQTSVELRQAVMDSLFAMDAITRDDRKHIDQAKYLMGKLSQTAESLKELEDNIGILLDAVQEISRLSFEAKDSRLALDRLLRFWERKWWLKDGDKSDHNGNGQHG